MNLDRLVNDYLYAEQERRDGVSRLLARRARRARRPHPVAWAIAWLLAGMLTGWLVTR